MFYPPNNKAPIIIRKISAAGSTNQATKTKVPKTITPIKEIEPITTVTDLMQKPKLREIKLKIRVSKKALKENPWRYLVISRRQG